MKVLVFNGWAAGPETWALCTFEHDWVFDYVEQLDGLPEKVIEGFDEVLLVGFSMGGSSALRMLLKYPEKVKGLVLVSATPCMMEGEKKVERIGEGEGGGGGEEGGDWDGAGVWKGMSERRLAALRLGTRLMFRDDPSPMYDVRNMERGLVYLKNTDLRNELLAFRASRETAKRRNLPVSVFQSEHDGIVRPNNADFLKKIFPQAKVTMVPGNEHVLPIRVPERIDEAVFDIIGIE